MPGAEDHVQQPDVLVLGFGITESPEGPSQTRSATTSTEGSDAHEVRVTEPMSGSPSQTDFWSAIHRSCYFAAAPVLPGAWSGTPALQAGHVSGPGS